MSIHCNCHSTNAFFTLRWAFFTFDWEWFTMWNNIRNTIKLSDKNSLYIACATIVFLFDRCCFVYCSVCLYNSNLFTFELSTSMREEKNTAQNRFLAQKQYYFRRNRFVVQYLWMKSNAIHYPSNWLNNSLLCCLQFFFLFIVFYFNIIWQTKSIVYIKTECESFDRCNSVT